MIFLSLQFSRKARLAFFIYFESEDVRVFLRAPNLSNIRSFDRLSPRSGEKNKNILRNSKRRNSKLPGRNASVFPPINGSTVVQVNEMQFSIHISSGVFLEYRTIVLAALKNNRYLFNSVQALNATLLLSRVRMTGQSSNARTV